MKRVCSALVNHASDFIHYPRTEQERDHIKGQFFRYCGIPYITGLIDCTHVKIQLCGPDERSFVNRKGKIIHRMIFTFHNRIRMAFHQHANDLRL